MTRKIKKGSGIYAFLEASGVLEHGSDAEITAMRKRYYKEYKKNWRKEKRGREREFTVAYTETELQIIADAARKHHKTCVRLIQEAALAYCAKHYLIDITVLSQIRELLARIYSAVEGITEDTSVLVQPTNHLLQKIDSLETTILSHLHQSKSLEDWLTETVTTNPETKTAFLKLLQNT